MFPVYVECRGYADNLDGTIGTGSKDECCDFYSAESVGSDGERAWTIEGGASYFSSSASAFHDSSGRYELVLVLRLLICCYEASVLLDNHGSKVTDCGNSPSILCDTVDNKE